MYALVNGHEVPLAKATLSLEDRGLVFADAVYEVIAIRSGRMVDLDYHLERLERSLHELGIPLPMPLRAFKLRLASYIARQSINSALLYLQISRGTLRRQHAWLDQTVVPNWFLFLQPDSYKGKIQILRVRTELDPRWKRVDIKTVNLLPNCLSRQKAFQDGFDDVWYYDAEGRFREATSANIWLVCANVILTPPLTTSILPGTVRRRIIDDIAQARGMSIQEVSFTQEQIFTADEAFQSGTGGRIAAIGEIDGQKIGDGGVGPLTRTIAEEYARVNV